MINTENTQNATQQLFAVFVHGKQVSKSFGTPQQAERNITELSPAHQTIAEVVQVTADGKQFLLG
jgi:hypothetical protein